MSGEETEKKVYDAASKGDVATFQQLLQENPYLLDGLPLTSSSRNVLHIATMQGQIGIVEEVLRRNPELARDLDSQNSSPLHIAAAKGSQEIASKLVSIAPETCWWLNWQNMNPIHIAAMKGHVEILNDLVEVDPLPAMERLHRGQTVLHLCVKHRQLDAFKVLVEKFGELVCAKDDYGDTILHWAVRSKQSEMIRCLVESKTIKLQLTRNSAGKTAFGLLKGDTSIESSEIRELLYDKLKNYSLPGDDVLMFTNLAMVVAILVATMAFQAAISPPRGVWQDNSATHKVGEAVMAYSHPKIYLRFVCFNAMSFASSLLAIFLLSTRFSAQNIYFLVASLSAMWVSLVSITLSFGAALIVTIPNNETHSFDVIWFLVPTFIAILMIIVIWWSEDPYIKEYTKFKIRSRLNRR